MNINSKTEMLLGIFGVCTIGFLLLFLLNWLSHPTSELGILNWMLFGGFFVSAILFAATQLIVKILNFLNEL